MINGTPICEWIDDAGVRCVCTKGLEIAHVDLDAMKSAEAKRAKPLTADDGRLYCKPHHTAFDAASKADLAKAIRVQDRATGAARPKKGFARVAKEKPQMRVANGEPALMRRGFVPASDPR